MNKVFHHNTTPYGHTTAILLGDASAYVMVTKFKTNDRVAVIHDLVVLKDRRGEGLGNELLEEAVAQAIRMGVDAVRLSAIPGSWLEEWYKRHGFRETGEIEDLGTNYNILERSL